MGDGKRAVGYRATKIAVVDTIDTIADFRLDI